MKIGIIGYGNAAETTRNLLKDYHEIKTYDPRKESNQKPDSLNGSEIIFIYAGTPQYIQDALRTIKNQELFSSVAYINGILPLGTVKGLEELAKMHIGHSPVVYPGNASKIIIGGNTQQVRDAIRNAYLPAFPNGSVKYIDMTTSESEMTGLASYIFDGICDVFKMNRQTVRQAFEFPERNGNGSNGKSLSELISLVNISNQEGPAPELLKILANSKPHDSAH
ncbi:MAG TPA: hypothetical protein VMC07_01065 [Candidatus Omnitrophota bacterium]|nr:hypothetical protein [Candidatus Omnitrophota bacterium]